MLPLPIFWNNGSNSTEVGTLHGIGFKFFFEKVMFTDFEEQNFEFVGAKSGMVTEFFPTN